MSTTGELRRLLDERGVEYEARTSPRGIIWTYWDAFNGHRVYAMDNENGTVEIFGEWDVTPEQAIEATLGYQITEDTSDGWHSFKDLYHHRAVLFSVIVQDHQELAWKSKRHHDGTMYDNMFIVGIETPTGQATYHYDIDPYWEMFDCKELEKAPEWDGHTPADAIARIATLGRGTCHDKNGFDPELGFECTVCGAMVDSYMVTPMEMGHVRQFAYCPFCGARVVEVDE